MPKLIRVTMEMPKELSQLAARLNEGIDSIVQAAWIEGFMHGLTVAALLMGCSWFFSRRRP